MKENKYLLEFQKMVELKEEENEEFMFFLKGYNHHEVDKIVHELNIKYFNEIDCTKCGNCCKRLIPALSLEEINTITEHLNLSYQDFKNKYIERKTARGFVFKGDSCPFLIDNKCLVYSCRPEPCRTFPHLHEKNINHRLINIFDNSQVCPIIFSVLEELKEILWDKDKHLEN